MFSGKLEDETWLEVPDSWHPENWIEKGEWKAVVELKLYYLVPVGNSLKDLCADYFCQ